MRIDSSNIGMASVRNYKATSTTIRRITMEYKEGLAGNGSALESMAGGNAENAGGEKAAEGMEAGNPNTLQDWQTRMQTSGSGAAVRNSASQTYASIRHATVRYIFELLFSARRERLNRWMKNNGIQNSGADQTSWEQRSGWGSNAGSGGLYQDGQSGEMMNVTARLGVLNYNQTVIRTEAESISFSTEGTVQTSDGRSIHFNVNVGMSREFQQYYERNMTMGTFSMCDPLVINLDTDLAQLSDQNFFFDIDGDGEKDQISRLGPGSGYLALDKNGDGIINDGNELFGTSSGNGFADLAEYDGDGNGWIDENDEVWSRLKIWCQDENGKDVLYTLAEKGVGAICLKNVSTDFTMKSQEGRTKGAVRSSGIFLYENGSAGTIQHVDMAKYSARA